MVREAVARLASYKFEGDALNWWKAFKQAKGGEEEYHTIRQGDGELTEEFMKRFLRLAGFVGKKAGPPEEQAKHFKWALNDWILDGIVNMEFTDVAQVANTGRIIELLCKRSGVSNKRNRDGDRIQSGRNNNQRGYEQRRTNGRNYDVQNNRQRGYDQRGNGGRNYDRQGGNCGQMSYQQNRDRQYNRSSGSSSQQKYLEYPSAPCKTCGKHHPGKECYRATGACFTYGMTGHMARDCPKNGRSGNRGSGSDKKPDVKGKVYALTRDQAANSSGIVTGTLFMNGRAVFVLFDTGATHSVI
ncbi:zinc finger, CCHC-type, retrotransposon gag domain protein, partial [Tanacetum coccineum]